MGKRTVGLTRTRKVGAGGLAQETGGREKSSPERATVLGIIRDAHHDNACVVFYRFAGRIRPYRDGRHNVGDVVVADSKRQTPE